MCNLYSITTTQQAMRQLFKVLPTWDRTGNLPPLTGVFPDYPAPVVDHATARARTLARFGR